MKPSLGLLLLAASGILGCTDLQLRRNTVRESTAAFEIEQQQVLDNLALFVSDFNALPSFSYPNQGSSIVIDAGNAGMTPGWSRITQGPSAGEFLFSALGLSLTASRQAQESFTLQPISDPRRLELMRCAYQRAVSNCGHGPGGANGSMTATFDPAYSGKESERCPDCEAVFNKFYTGEASGVIRDHAQGITTSDCLKSDFCWFCTGPKKCVPKHCSLVGRCRDVYVWVPPEGREQLTRLTLMILDFAVNNAPVPLAKQVVYYIDEYGIPTRQSLAVGQVSASIAIDEQNASLLSVPTSEEGRIERLIRARLARVNEELANLKTAIENAHKQGVAAEGKGPSAAEKTPGRTQNEPDFERYKQLLDEKLSLEHKLAYLGEQLATPGLKHRFYSAGPSVSPGAALLPFQQNLNTLAPAPATIPFAVPSP
jgi:hypothetical protein